MRRAALIAAGGVTVLALALALRGDGAAPAGEAWVRVDPSRPGAVVPRSFLGISIEWDSVLPYTGPAGRRRDELLQVLAPVERAARSPLALRIGGDTGDQAWWNPRGRPRPPMVLQDVGPPTLDAIAWLGRGLHGPVTLGVNLALDDPGNAVTLVREARRRLPPGALGAVEIGNEPDLYTHAHTFRRGGHLHRRVRKRAAYGPADYEAAAERYLAAFTKALHPAPLLVVGGFAGRAWWPALAGLLDRAHGRAGALAGHLYALPQCAAPTPSRAWLTGPGASRARAAFLEPLARLAHARRLPLHVAELNSAACGGRPGWSDTPAAALWLTDMLFALLDEGAARADVHTWRGASYAPFAVRRDRIVARPPLAGMLAFARAAPSGSRLVPADVGAGTSLRAWATRDPAGVTRVALLAPNAVTAHVRVGARRRTLMLRAESVTVLTVR